VRICGFIASWTAICFDHVLSWSLLTLTLQSHLSIPRGLQVTLQERRGRKLDLTPGSSLVYLHFHGRLNNIYFAEILNLPLHSTTNIEMVQDFRNSTIQGGSFLKVDGDYHFSVSGGSGESRFSTSPLRKLRVGFKASKH
jgi:hypothetical protein